MKGKIVEVIDNSEIKECWACKGTGFGNVKEIECPICKGTGKWREPSYIMIVETPDGKKIGFKSDFIK